MFHRAPSMQRRGVFCFVRQDSAFIGAPYTMMFGGQRLCLGSGARSQLLSAGVRGEFGTARSLTSKTRCQRQRSQKTSFATRRGWLLYELVVAELTCRCRLLYCFTSINYLEHSVPKGLILSLSKAACFWMVGLGTHSQILPPDLKGRHPGGPSSQSIPAYPQARIKVPQ